MTTPIPSPEEIEKIFEELRQLGPRRVTDVMLLDYRSQYLRSARWHQIKKRVLDRDKGICQSCGGDGDVVHHRSYTREVLEGNDDSMLITVCSGCHELIHFDDDGNKRNEAETDEVLLAGQRQIDIQEIRIDLRKDVASPPANWHRLTAMQRKLWYEMHNQLRREKLLKRKKNKPPRKLGGFFGPEF